MRWLPRLASLHKAASSVTFGALDIHRARSREKCARRDGDKTLSVPFFSSPPHCHPIFSCSWSCVYADWLSVRGSAGSCSASGLTFAWILSFLKTPHVWVVPDYFWLGDIVHVCRDTFALVRDSPKARRRRNKENFKFQNALSLKAEVASARSRCCLAPVRV